MKLHQLALAAFAALSVGAAQADSFTFSGTLAATDATFNRPLTTTSLSSVGTSVYYDAYTLVGVTPGSYNFLMTSSFDTYLVLYAGAFNPSSPLTNVAIINDDFNSSLTQSGFTYTLLANTSYTLVSTSFSNGTVGAYIDTITPVPEPQTLALMLAGIGVVGFVARRRA